MRKNGKRGKVIAVAAAGALVVLLASTIARCAAAGPAEAAASTLEAAAGTSWVAEDGSGATLQVTDRSLVESATDGTVSALAYSAADEAEADGQAIVTLTLEDRKSTRLNSSHIQKSRMPSSA